MSSQETPVCMAALPLPNGGRIPLTGHGALQKGMEVGDDQRDHIVDTLVKAIQGGLRLIDTAKVYATEPEVGEAVRSSGVPREDICVVTKLWGTDHANVKEAFEESLNRLNIGYIDIYLLHWPQAMDAQGKGLPYGTSPTHIETWKDMEKLVGPTCKAIGVSNFSQKTLEELFSQTSVKPAVNQIEVHPMNPALKLVPYCQERGIQVMAWGTLAGGANSHYGDAYIGIYQSPVLIGLAEKHGLSAGDLLLSWIYSRSIVAIPQSSKPERIISNMRVKKLPAEDVEAINNMHKTLGLKKLIDSADFMWQELPGKGKTLCGWTMQELGFEDEAGNWLI